MKRKTYHAPDSNRTTHSRNAFFRWGIPPPLSVYLGRYCCDSCDKINQAFRLRFSIHVLQAIKNWTSPVLASFPASPFLAGRAWERGGLGMRLVHFLAADINLTYTYVTRHYTLSHTITHAHMHIHTITHTHSHTHTHAHTITPSH